MKLDILIVDFALVALVVAPYILFIFLGRREGKRLRNKFNKEALNHQLSITEEDSWNLNIIGLDVIKGTILLVRKKRIDFHIELISLKEIKSCEILREVRTLKINHHMEDILQRIDLILTSYDDSIRIVNFYNCEETYAQDYELKHAEKWKDRINAMISYHPTINSAA